MPTYGVVGPLPRYGFTISGTGAVQYLPSTSAATIDWTSDSGTTGVFRRAPSNKSGKSTSRTAVKYLGSARGDVARSGDLATMASICAGDIALSSSSRFCNAAVSTVRPEE